MMRNRKPLLAVLAFPLLLAACDEDGVPTGVAAIAQSFGTFFAKAFDGGTVSADADPLAIGNGRPAGFAAVDPTADPRNF